MTEKLRKYEATVRLKMPGNAKNAKETDYTFSVAANTPSEAMVQAVEEWKRITDPRDVRVKEVERVMTAESGFEAGSRQNPP
jgi:acylphosphatase